MYAHNAVRVREEGEIVAVSLFFVNQPLARPPLDETRCPVGPPLEANSKSEPHTTTPSARYYKHSSGDVQWSHLSEIPLEDF